MWREWEFWALGLGEVKRPSVKGADGRRQRKEELTTKADCRPIPTENNIILESRDKCASVFLCSINNDRLKGLDRTGFAVHLCDTYCSSITPQTLHCNNQTTNEEMAPVLPILVKLLAALNGTNVLSYQYHHHHRHHHYHHYRHHSLSGRHHPAPFNLSAIENCTEFGLAGMKSWSKTIGIPSIAEIPGSTHNRDVASSNTSEWAGIPFHSLSSSSKSTAKRTLHTTVNKVRSRGNSGDGKEKPDPLQLLWDFAVVFILFVGGLLVLGSLIRLAVLVGSRLKQKLREQLEQRERRQAKEAKKWNVLTRRVARTSGDPGQVLPARPISNNNFPPIPEDLNIGFASPSRNAVVDEEDLERGRPLRRFGDFDPRNPRPRLVSSSIADGKNKREASRSHLRSECTLCEESSLLVRDGEDRRSEGTLVTSDGAPESLSRDEYNVSDGHPAIRNSDDYARFQSIFP